MKQPIMFGLFLLMFASAAAAQGTTTVCHRPPGNPTNVKLISVNSTDVSGHLAHGDHLAFDGNCFVYTAGPQNSVEAEQVCVARFGGHLASIHSQAENNFVSALVDPRNIGGITASIGGTAPGGFCAGPTAAYAWTDGTPWDYENWRLTTGEPNCSGAPGAVQLWPTNSANDFLSGWNDVPADAPLGGFVCEYKP